MRCLRSSMPQVDRGFVTLVASDYPGIEVCDPNGHWYLADGVSGPNDLLLLTGRALSHVTAGLRPVSQYRTTYDNRSSLTFKLMPHANAILDYSPILAAGHCIRQIYQPVSASQFMDDSCAEEHAVSSHLEEPSESQGNFVSDPSLRSVLSDPLSLDALFVMEKLTHPPCFLILERCDREYDVLRRTGSSRDNGELVMDTESLGAVKGVQYPFVVGERVLIMENKRTPEKFVGKEAVITSQCLNGWYLVKALDSGESTRLQYRSLKKVSKLQLQTQARLQHLVFLQDRQ